MTRWLTLAEAIAAHVHGGDSIAMEGFTHLIPFAAGPYPWANHHNAWRPSHIHFSLFGAGILSRLATQMYFPGDPLQPLDPIFNSVPDEGARQRLVSRLDMGRSESN